MEDMHLTESYKKLITEQQDLNQRIQTLELRSSINMFLCLFIAVVLFVMYITGTLAFTRTT